MEPSSSSTSAGSNGSSYGNGSVLKASGSSMGPGSVQQSPSLGPVDSSVGVGRGPAPAGGHVALAPASGPIPSGSQHRRPHPISRHNYQLYQTHTAELASYISSVFLPSVLPTAEEYQVGSSDSRLMDAGAVAYDSACLDRRKSRRDNTSRPWPTKSLPELVYYPSDPSV